MEPAEVLLVTLVWARNSGTAVANMGTAALPGAYCDEGCSPDHGSCGTKKRSQLRERQGNATPSTNTTTSGTPVPVASSTTIPSQSSTSASSRVQNGTVCSAKPTPAATSCVRCEGQPGTDQWCGYDIHTDYYKSAPKTCRTVEYTFEITNTTIAPDGIHRIALLVNGQMPGPTIEANWGDTVKVTVINRMQDNGTTIHFHGVRQSHTNQYDGVPSLTQCPIAPGEQMTYTWVAELYGSSWYHSHFAIQAWEGVFGPLVIHGPKSADYDIDAGHIMLQDWNHQTAFSQYDIAQDAIAGQNGGARVLDTGLINGKNTWGQDGTYNQTGSRFQLDVIQGKSYLLRVVNVAIQSTFKFYIDGHSLTVIAEDFTPIVPYTTNILNINIGQRYEVIVNADQAIGDFWMRSDNQDTCAGLKQGLDIKGIFHYEGGSGATPTTTPYTYVTSCTDEDIAVHTPILAFNVSDPGFIYDANVTVAPANNLFKWYISGTTFQSQWGDPTLLDIIDEGTTPSYSGKLLFDAPNQNEWVYLIVESDVPLPHPVHLHGHDFYVLAQGSGSYSSDVPLKLQNPSRRDTILMPGGGFVVIAWQAENPGIWLIHCHVGWHVAMGLAAQVVELKDQIAATVDDCGAGMKDTCTAWNKFAVERGLQVDDSGV